MRFTCFIRNVRHLKRVHEHEITAVPRAITAKTTTVILCQNPPRPALHHLNVPPSVALTSFTRHIVYRQKRRAANVLYVLVCCVCVCLFETARSRLHERAAGWINSFHVSSMCILPCCSVVSSCVCVVYVCTYINALSSIWLCCVRFN